MLLLATTLALSFLGSLVNAQSSTSDIALDIVAIQAHFTNAELVPELLTTFNPDAVLNVTFHSNLTITPGQNLTTEQVADAPDITLTPANSSVTLTGNFTLVMVDANVVGTNESVEPQTRHWLVNGVTLKNGTSGVNVSTAGALAVTNYAGPSPASGSGPHRYVILLYTQPSDFSPPANLSSPGGAVGTFQLSEYVSTSKLGPLVAGMYFTVEVGAANASIPATSAVVSSTLKVPTPASATASGSASTAKQSSTTHNAATRSGCLNSVIAIPASLVILFVSYVCL